MTLNGRIVSWDPAKGYGSVEAGGARVFLHIRDFAERHKRPEVGDEIIFEKGTDAKGRVCAKAAVHRHDGGRLRSAHLAILAGLIAAPAVAGWRLLGPDDRWYLFGGYAFASLVAYGLYAIDKGAAREKSRRLPESLLHFVEFFGGWPGAFIAQRRLRHKCSKVSYQFGFWLIVAVHQYVAVDTLLGWRISPQIFMFSAS